MLLENDVVEESNSPFSSNLVVVKKGDNEVEGLTDDVLPKRLGPKRASNIRKLWGLEKDEDVRKFVIRREVKKGDKVIARKAPKIQRLVTKAMLQRKRTFRSQTRKRMELAKQLKARVHYCSCKTPLASPAIHSEASSHY